MRAGLASRELDARIIESPLAPPARLTWRLDAGGLTSSLYPDLPDSAIDGFLVRDTGWLDPAGWENENFAYMQAELRAVMLAWLAGLSCPVINRPDASQWYRAGVPLVAWQRPSQRWLAAAGSRHHQQDARQGVTSSVSDHRGHGMLI